MKHSNVLCLALFSGLALMGFAGAGSASANIDMCTWTTTMPSALGQVECLEAGGAIHGLLNGSLTFESKATSPKVKGNLEQVCDESKVIFKNKGDKTTGAEMTTLTFVGNCKPCTTVTVFAPYEANIYMSAGEYAFQSAFKIKFTGCPLGVTCKFGTGAKGNMDGLEFKYGTNMSNNIIKAEGELLEFEEGSKMVCGEKAEWTGNYIVSSPANWFFYLL
jgi:hypothetical protein